MPKLTTLHIQANPADSLDKEPDARDYGAFGYTLHFTDWKAWDERGKAGLRFVPPPPDVAVVQESLAVWARYNRALQLVVLGGQQYFSG
jgi:hypothetical protein